MKFPLLCFVCLRSLLKFVSLISLVLLIICFSIIYFKLPDALYKKSLIVLSNATGELSLDVS